MLNIDKQDRQDTDLRHELDSEARLASPTAEDNVADLTKLQLEGIRHRVRASIESIDAGEFRKYEGREGLKKLADRVRARGRKLLAQVAPGQ